MVEMIWRPKLILFSLFGLFLAFTTVALARQALPEDYGTTFKNLWKDVSDTSCKTTDLNCVAINAATSMENFLFTQIVGVEYDEVTPQVTAAMINGEWDRGLAAATGRLIGSAYAYPPDVHLAGYFDRLLSNNLLNSPAQAAHCATVGVCFLKSIQDFWTSMRNLAYGLFLIIMVSIGLMIILRREIAPRVVISFANALPKIVIGLALITFSFPLIALAVDVGLVFGSELVKNVVAPPELTLIGAKEKPPSAAEAASSQTKKALGVSLDGLAGQIFGAFVGLLAGVIFGMAAVIIGILALLRLLLSYAKILLATIFSPLVILIGTLPGQEGVLASLTKNVLVNVLTFPAVLFFLLLGSFFLQTGGVDVFPHDSGAAGLVAQSSTLFSAQIAASILALISALFAWRAPSMIEAAFGEGKPRGKR